MKTRGSCLCGSVRFEIEGAFDSFFLCHCSRCRKGTGSAHASNLFAGRATLHWVSGSDRVKTFSLPSTRHVRSFCSLCGSGLPTVHADLERVVVPAGSLDEDAPIQPTAHIFLAAQARWEKLLESTPGFEGLPSSE